MAHGAGCWRPFAAAPNRLKAGLLLGIVISSEVTGRSVESTVLHSTRSGQRPEAPGRSGVSHVDPSGCTNDGGAAPSDRRRAVAQVVEEDQAAVGRGDVRELVEPAVRQSRGQPRPGPFDRPSQSAYSSSGVSRAAEVNGQSSSSHSLKSHGAPTCSPVSFVVKR